MNHSNSYFVSDKRVKQNICPVSGCLSKLDMIDFVSYDLNHLTSELCEVGVIAQNVAEVFPTMVVTRNDFIPNIYKESEHSLISDNTVLVYVKNDLKENTKILLIITQRDISKYTLYATVTNVTPETIEVEKWPNYSQTDIVCVYGEMVDDFHVVDGEQIGILGAACVKELHQQVKCQADKIAGLEAANALLQQQITDILARLP